MGIGLIRTLLALSVVLMHTGSIKGFQMVRGDLAVQSFFIISGFYTAMILNEKYKDSYFLFYSNRALRLYPVYLVVLFLSILLFVVLFILNKTFENPIDFYIDNNINISSYLYLIMSNLLLVGQDIALFMGLNENGSLYYTDNFLETSPMVFKFLFVPQAWSLSLEILFYIIAPFILRKNIRILSFFIALSLTIRAILYIYGLQNDPWSYRFFPSELATFLFGSLAYRIYIKYYKSNPSNKIDKIATYSLIVFTIFYQYIPINESIKYIIYLTAIFACLPLFFRFSKRLVLDRKIGDLSYIIYISHIFVMYFVLFINVKYKWFSLATCILTIVFSYYMLKYIQLPIDKLRSKRVLDNKNT